MAASSSFIGRARWAINFTTSKTLDKSSGIHVTTRWTIEILHLIFPLSWIDDNN